MTSTNRTSALGVGILVLAGVAAVSWIAFGREAHPAPAAQASSSPAAIALMAATPSPTPAPTVTPSPTPATSPSLPPSGPNLLCTQIDALSALLAGPKSDAWATLQALRAAQPARPILLALVWTGSADELVAMDSVRGTTTTLAKGITLTGSTRPGEPIATLAWSPRGSRVLIGVRGGCGQTAVLSWTADGVARLDRADPTIDTGIEATWSPDGDTAALLEDAGATIWPPQTTVNLVGSGGDPIETLPALPCKRCAPVGPLSWSPDGRWLAVPYHVYGRTGEAAPGVAVACMIGTCRPHPGAPAKWLLLRLPDPQLLEWRRDHELVASGIVNGRHSVVAIDPAIGRSSSIRVILDRGSDIVGAVPGAPWFVTEEDPGGGATLLAVRDLRNGWDRPVWHVPAADGLGFTDVAASRQGSLIAVSTGNPRLGDPTAVWILSTVNHHQVSAAPGMVLGATFVPPLR